MTRYIIQVTFHSAHNLPVADLSTLSCDPYIHATLLLNHLPPHPDPPLTFRTPTIHRNRNPEWTTEKRTADDKLPNQCHWMIGGIDPSGFTLVLRVRDEDPSVHDDRLGRVHVKVGHVSGELNIQEEQFRVLKRRSQPLVYLKTYLASVTPKKEKRINKHAYLVVSVKVLREDNSGQKCVYTLGPNKWSQHFSPLIGALAPARHTKPDAKKEKPSNSKIPDPNALEPTLSSTSSLDNVQSSTFIGNKIQLTGPVPKRLHLQFVGYASFVRRMFKDVGIRGRLLNKAMKHQYRTIYKYDKSTVYGVIEEDEDFASRFLKMTAFGTGGRIFTYVITLDGEWRFTETGEEFAVDLLSKHTMHADVAQFIAFSGEFFIRRCVNEPGGGFESAAKVEKGTIGQSGKSDGKARESSIHSEDVQIEEEGELEEQNSSRHNPKLYELVIDNDSGTYRPDKSLLPVLRDWLDTPERLGALGRVTAVDGFDEKLKQVKKERAEKKKKKGRQGGGMLRRGSSVSDVGTKLTSPVGLAKILPQPAEQR